MIKTIKDLERNMDKIANLFYNEKFKELEKLTGIKTDNQQDFEIKLEKLKKNLLN